MPREVAWPQLLLSSRFAGIGGQQAELSLQVLLILSLLSNTVPATLAHWVCDSHCTSFLPLFISTLPVVSPPKPYGSPLNKCF